MKVALQVAVLSFGLQAAVSATPLITFHDGSLNSAAQANLTDTTVNWAVSWTQSIGSNVTLSAILSSNLPTPGSWYVATQIGPGTTSTDVVYSGTYSPPSFLSPSNFDLLPRTTLATGLSFAPGTYYLVLDGPRGGLPDNADWVGDFTGVTTTLAPGFTLALPYFVTFAPDPFAPSSSFSPNAGGPLFVFELDEGAPVPEPSTLSLLGLGLVTIARRRWRK